MMDSVSEHLRELGADAWLLYDFGDRNPIAHGILGLGATTRPAFALLPRDGDPTLLRHTIEASAWTHWAGTVIEYTGWRELHETLRGLLSGVSVVAMEVSERGAIPAVDRVPAGIVALVQETGVRVVTSGDLVTATYSRWSDEGRTLHRKAAAVLARVANDAFRHAAMGALGDEPVTEGALAERIRVRLREGGVDRQVGMIVAGGARSADPHYEPGNGGLPLVSGEVLLIDLWGAIGPTGIPADQTWMGVLAPAPTERVLEVWNGVRDARDAAIRTLTGAVRAGEPIRGWQVDRVARDLLADRGLADHFVHRLGHSIDARLHGSGPNLDDLETRDERLLLPGIGFSVEPGAYLRGGFGMRSEVNVYLAPNGPEVTPDPIQTELLLAR